MNPAARPLWMKEPERFFPGADAFGEIGPRDFFTTSRHRLGRRRGAPHFACIEAYTAENGATGYAYAIFACVTPGPARACTTPRALRRPAGNHARTPRTCRRAAAKSSATTSDDGSSDPPPGRATDDELKNEKPDRGCHTKAGLFTICAQIAEQDHHAKPAYLAGVILSNKMSTTGGRDHVRVYGCALSAA